jgi:hypothetical protein
MAMITTPEHENIRHDRFPHPSLSRKRARARRSAYGVFFTVTSWERKGLLDGVE